MSLIRRAFRFLQRRRQAYQRTFPKGSYDAQIVLADLAKFCRAHDSTFHPTAAVANRLDGRREVWLRLQNHLQLTEEELWELHKPQSSETE